MSIFVQASTYFTRFSTSETQQIRVMLFYIFAQSQAKSWFEDEIECVSLCYL